MWRSILVIFFLSTVSASTLSQSEIMKITKSCAEKNHVNLEAFTKFDPENTNKPSEEYFCTSKCILEGLGGIDSEGNFVESVVEEYMGAEVPENTKGEVFACLKTFPKIKECQDLENIRQCVLPIVKKLQAKQ